MAQIFRKSAIERLSSPEQLDRAIVVSSPMSWAGLIGVFLILASVTIWAFTGTIPETVALSGQVASVNEETVIQCLAEVDDMTFLKEGMKVIINPASVNDQKYGHMEGKITEINVSSEITVICEIKKDETSENGFYWSNANGKKLTVFPGSMADVKVIISESAPISKVIPGFRMEEGYEKEI